MSYDTDWHYVGETGEPDFENDWSGQLRFKKGADGVVRIEGSVNGNNGSASIFTLPVGYRTDISRNIICSYSTGYAQLYLWASGIMSSGATIFNLGININYYVGDTEYPGTDGEDGADGADGADGIDGSNTGFLAYDSTATYGINAIVASMGTAWISQKDNNEGVTPGTNEANWKEAFRILTPYDEYSGGSATSGTLLNTIDGGN